MSKLTRQTAKVFGSDAGTNQLAQFGSLFAASPNFVIPAPASIPTIQALSNYLTGWFAAAIGGDSPCIEDMNAICYLFAYQIAYSMQTGVPEWDASTTYYKGSMVNDGFGRIYTSVADGNTNHAITNTTYWGQQRSLPIGSVIATFPNLTGAFSTVATTVADASGYVLCVGQTIADATSPMNGQIIPNINNDIFLKGSTTAGTAGGSSTSNALLAHTHAFTSSTSVGSSSHEHNFTHVHQWAFFQFSNTSIYMTSTPANNQPSFSTGTGGVFEGFTGNSGYTTGGTSALKVGTGLTGGGVDKQLWTTGPTNDGGLTILAKTPSGPDDVTTVSGTTNSSGSGSSFSIVPPFISTVYIMAIK